MEADELAEELRQSIGRLVRATRTVDTMRAGEAAVLGFLDRGGPLTTAEIADRRGVTHQSAAATVKALAATGLVRGEPHPVDGRKVLLHLSAAGRTRLRRERTRRAHTLGTAIRETLTAAEQARLRECTALLARLSSYLVEE